MTKCEIEFENKNLVVYSGKVVRGTVHLSLTSSQSVRRVYIKIVGQAQTYWTEGAGNNKQLHSGEENYLDERIYFFGGSHGNQIG